MLKREWGAESNGKLPHLFIPSKTATLVPEFAVEDLPLGRTAALVPEFAVKDLPWAEHYNDDDDDVDTHNKPKHQHQISFQTSQYIQSGREISANILTDDYLCYKEPKSLYNFYSYFNI